ncbi:MAG: hypothetical protein GY820_06350 [Gammaproteobacteria bacterium]|nr:hypothetical protein [Gammaproteobacteria bacterium]
MITTLFFKDTLFTQEGLTLKLFILITKMTMKRSPAKTKLDMKRGSEERRSLRQIRVRRRARRICNTKAQDLEVINNSRIQIEEVMVRREIMVR